MVDDQSPYLTVKEAAERARVVPQTMYRWCRSGRIPALKFGREWRIPRELTGKVLPAGDLQLDVFLTRLIEHSGHFLALASDNVALARLEATFVDVAAKAGIRLIHGRWNEDAESVRQRLRPAIHSARGLEGSLRLLEFSKPYDQREAEGPVQLMAQELERAAVDGLRCAMYGSAYGYFGQYFVRLTQFERAVDERFRGVTTLLLCGYALPDLFSLYEGAVLAVLLEVIQSHDGIIMFNGQRALLLRPSGR